MGVQCAMVEDPDGSKESRIRRGPDRPMRNCEWTVLWKWHGRRHSAVSCAKMAEPIDMLFGLCTRVSPRKHALGGVHTGATWRIPVYRPCAVAMRPFCQITLTTCFIYHTQRIEFHCTSIIIRQVFNGGGHVTPMTSSVCNGRRSNDSSYRSGEFSNNVFSSSVTILFV